MTDAHAAVTHTHDDGTHDDDTLPIHEQTIQQVFAGLNPNGEKGLSSQRAAELLAEHGPNELDKPPRVSLLMLFVIQLNSVIMYLLMAAVVASAAIRATGDGRSQLISYVDSIAIMIIVIVNATIAAVTENQANDALEALSSLQSPQCTVVRDGKEVTVESRDLVPGDIVCLSTGDVVPADVRCIKTSDFRVNEVCVCVCVCVCVRERERERAYPQGITPSDTHAQCADAPNWRARGRGQVDQGQGSRPRPPREAQR